MFNLTEGMPWMHCILLLLSRKERDLSNEGNRKWDLVSRLSLLMDNPHNSGPPSYTELGLPKTLMISVMPLLYGYDYFGKGSRV